MSPLSMEDDAALTRLELSISYFLRYGVLTSAVFLAGGFVMQLMSGSDVLVTFHDYRPESLFVTYQKAMSGHAYGQLASLLGLAILVSLPILRVIFTAVLFLKQRDWWLAAIATFVFSVLLASFILGIDL